VVLFPPDAGTRQWEWFLCAIGSVYSPTVAEQNLVRFPHLTELFGAAAVVGVCLAGPT
jgi:hypothetical protein